MSITCIQCSRDIDEKKPWMTIHNGSASEASEASEAPCSYLCSYLCYRRGRDKYPKNLWPLVQNKEDFQDIRPIQNLQPAENPFQFLRHEDLLQMSDAEVDHYYDNRHNQVTMNPLSGVQEEEEEREDMRVRELEEELETGSGAQWDDY
jgi:hypothetical protein